MNYETWNQIRFFFKIMQQNQNDEQFKILCLIIKYRYFLRELKKKMYPEWGHRTNSWAPLMIQKSGVCAQRLLFYIFYLYTEL